MSLAAPPNAPAATGTEAPATFHATYTAQFDFVWRCLRGLGVAERALDDAAQEVFVVVYRRLGEFRGDAGLRTWLYAIVRNVAANQRRSERRRGAPAPLDPELPSPERDAHAELEQREAIALVREFVTTLSAKNRDVFVLSQLEGLGMPEVAAILRIPTNTAYTRLRAARLAFERTVAEKARQR